MVPNRSVGDRGSRWVAARQWLTTLLLGVLLLALLTATASATDEYVLEQGEACHPIEPLETDGPVDAFYDYRNHETHPDTEENLYSSYGTQDLQRDDTSILMLHEGSDGLSLVTVHDRLEGDTEGGVASFEVVGVPGEAEWVVRDDEYDLPSNMAEWHSGDGWLAADWIWADARTDGGAINGGLEDAGAFTIHPAFNDDAPLADDPTIHDPDWAGDGRIDSWAFLSGDRTDPERIDLALDEPVTIRPGDCNGPSVTYERVDDEITASVEGVDGDGVTLESVTLRDVDPDEATPLERAPGAAEAAVADDEDPLFAVTTNASIDRVTPSLTDDESAATEPDALSIYERQNGTWHAVETTNENGTVTAALEDAGGIAIGAPAPDHEAARDDLTTVISVPAVAVGTVTIAALVAVGWLLRQRPTG